MALGSPILVSHLGRTPRQAGLAITFRTASVIRGLRGLPAPELGDSVSGSFDHHFTTDEIASELTTSGFTIVQSAMRPYPHVVAVAS